MDLAATCDLDLAKAQAFELMRAESFGHVQLVTIRYPQHIPTAEEFAEYAAGPRTHPSGASSTTSASPPR